MHWDEFYIFASIIELIAAATSDFMHVYLTFTGSTPVWSMSMRCFVIIPYSTSPMCGTNVPVSYPKLANKPIIYMPSLKRWISFAEPAACTKLWGISWWLAWTWNDSYLVGHFSDFQQSNKRVLTIHASKFQVLSGTTACCSKAGEANTGNSNRWMGKEGLVSDLTCLDSLGRCCFVEISVIQQKCGCESQH